MPADTPCPDDTALRRLVLGLAADAPADLEAHFAACAACVARAAELDDAADDLADAVRAAADTDATGFAAPSSVVDRFRRLTPPPPVADDLAGRRFGAYRVDRSLGRGGMGVVYLARHDRIDRPVALKVLPAGAGPDREQRFREVEQAVAALVHPNVVRVYEVGEAGGRPFLAMEYVGGGTLADRLAAAPLGPAAAARVVAAAARGVAEGHRRGVVHRDLKPANILLENAEQGMRNAESKPEDYGPDSAFRIPHSALRPKVADFGLARRPAADSGLTDTGALLGTPAYMAPEQAAGDRAVGPAADVYGLGAVLYECLTGRPPFKAASVLETLDQVRHRDPVPVRRLQPGVPKDLETVCLKCLEKDPRKRYASADDLADDLDRFGRGEPVRARPVGPLARAAKWARRRPTAAALVGVSVLSGVALAAVVGVYTARLRDEADRANRHAADAEQKRAEAAASYRASRDAINRIIARLDAAGAAGIPRLGELARDQLEDALAFYRGVLAEQPDPDPEVRLDAGRASAVAGSLQYYLGRPDAARDYLRRAVELLDGLPPEYRRRPECRASLVHAFNHLANLTGRPGDDESEGYFRRSLAEHEARVRDAPGDPAARSALARGEGNLAVVYYGRGDADRAEAHYLRAVAIEDDLLAGDPDDRAFRVDAAGTQANLGLLYAGTKRPGPAAAAFGRAEALLRPLVERASPPPGDAAGTLIGAYVNWGNLLRDERDPKGSLALLDKAVGLADAALALEPGHRDARSNAYNAHGSRAHTLLVLRRFADAAADYDRVVELAPDGLRTGLRSERAIALARAGRHGRAAAEVFDLAPGASGDALYNLACVLALAAKPAADDPALGPLLGRAAADAYAAAAVRLLGRLHADGYFKNPGVAFRMALDDDLAPLRARADYRAFQAKMAGKDKP